MVLKYSYHLVSQLLVTSNTEFNIVLANSYLWDKPTLTPFFNVNVETDHEVVQQAPIAQSYYELKSREGLSQMEKQCTGKYFEYSV